MDWKIAVAVRDDLEVWQKLNVTAFLVSGLGSAHPELIGENYSDASGHTYLSMFAIPVLVFSGDAAGMERAFRRASERELSMSVYTHELFTTYNDTDNRARVAAVGTEELSLAGFAAAGERRAVDKVFDRLRLHP
ncbi:MAG: DUF2000 family protein [Acidimicrobiia bacterium]|nr:DUF2000 family protein [Acidimicrobiia bacterium]